MKVSDDVLMAYVDNELDAETRATVEAAMAKDPDVAQRIARHKALRDRLRTAFDRTLREPVPERLLSVVRSTPAQSPRKAEVTDLARVRAAKQLAAGTQRRWSWPEWGSMTASLVLGLLIGYVLLRPPGDLFATSAGHLVAHGTLSSALSEQLAGEQAGEPVAQIGLSFVAKSGLYCRAFTTQTADSVAGIACRENNAWHVRMLMPNVSVASASGGYRMAGTALPPAITQAVGEQIDGEPLDAAGEMAARGSHWQK